MLASMNSPVKEELSRPSSKKKAGGTMMASKSLWLRQNARRRTCYKYVNANSQRIYDGLQLL
jgi:hypothetical protein